MTNLVRLLSALGLVAAMGLSQQALAAEGKTKFPGTFSANAGIFSEYRFRGLDQSDEQPALQGGIDWSAEVNKDASVYAGFWGSNVDFNDGDEANVEIDYYAGVRGSIKDIGWDLGFIYYSYPGAASTLNYDLIEVAVGLSYDVMENVSIGANYNFSPDFFGESGTAHWFQGSVSYAVPVDILAGLTLEASVGHQLIDKEATFGVKDYSTWTIGASLGLTDNVALGLQYVGTNAETTAGVEAVTGTDAFIGSLTASF